MDQYLNNRQNEILWNLLANPADNGHLYVSNLQNLVAEFPESGLLQVLLMRATGGQEGNGAAYFDPKTLYCVMNSIESLRGVSSSQIIQQAGENAFHTNVEEDEHEGPLLTEVAEISEEEQDVNEPEAIIEEEEVTPLNFIDDEIQEEIAEAPVIVIGDDEQAEVESIAQTVEKETNEQELSGNETSTETGVEETAEPIVITSENAGFYEDELVTEAGANEQAQQLPDERAEEHDYIEPFADEDELIDGEEAVTEAIPVTSHDPSKDIEDDIYDEIVGIENISFTPVNKPHDTDADQLPGDEPGDLPVIEESSEATEQHVKDEADELIPESVAASDYFVFEHAFDESKPAEKEESEDFFAMPLEEGVHIASNPITDGDTQQVSRYHDDQLPYTFLWWLNKTRKEHAGIYQPFKLDTTQAIKHQAADALQQQYYENIFHVSSVDELDKSVPKPTVEFDMKSREDRIIKKFITSDPHINPPSSDRLDNENKAKKSAEDQDELVTETLAQIYVDQMLYHKAINTYKKLILKFPEKRRYFADQIELLEKKIN